MNVLVCTLKRETSLGNLVVNIALNEFDYLILIIISLVQFRAIFIEGECFGNVKHITSMSQCSVALLSCRRSRICVGSLVTYVCVCGGNTSLGFSVDWTSSSLSRVDLSGFSWHRSWPRHIWEAAVVWAPAYSAVYLCLCLDIKRGVLQYRVIFPPRKRSRVPGYPLARVTTSTNVDDTASLSPRQGTPQYPYYIDYIHYHSTTTKYHNDIIECASTLTIIYQVPRNYNKESQVSRRRKDRESKKRN